MATPTVLFPDGGLVDATGTVPLGQTIPTGKTITNPTDTVTLVLSTGESVTIGKVAELMRLITAMRNMQVWYIMPTEDIIIMLVDSKALIIAEANFQNQKLMQSCCLTYNQGQLAWLQRGTAAILTTDEALQSVGHYRKLSSAYTSNYDLQQPTGSFSPRMLVVDYAFSASAGATAQGTQFRDSPPLTWPTVAGLS